MERANSVLADRLSIDVLSDVADHAPITNTQLGESRTSALKSTGTPDHSWPVVHEMTAHLAALTLNRALPEYDKLASQIDLDAATRCM